MPPENVILANHPMVVDRAKLDAFTERQDGRAANERDIVEMDDIESLREDGFDCRALDDRSPSLVSEKGRCQRPAAFELVNGYARRLSLRIGSWRWMQGASPDLPGIGIVDHLNFASAPGE